MTSRARLDEKNLKEVMNCLWPARLQYNEIGIALGIDATTLEVIKQENLKIYNRFVEVIKRWLRRGKPVPCWALLAEELSSPPVEVKVKEKNEGEFFDNHF